MFEINDEFETKVMSLGINFGMLAYTKNGYSSYCIKNLYTLWLSGVELTKQIVSNELNRFGIILK